MKTNYERKAEEDMKHISSLLTEKDARIAEYQKALEFLVDYWDLGDTNFNEKYGTSELNWEAIEKMTYEKAKKALSSPPSELLERIELWNKLEKRIREHFVGNGSSGSSDYRICEILRQLIELNEKTKKI